MQFVEALLKLRYLFYQNVWDPIFSTLVFGQSQKGINEVPKVPRSLSISFNLIHCIPFKPTAPRNDILMTLNEEIRSIEITRIRKCDQSKAGTFFPLRKLVFPTKTEIQRFVFPLILCQSQAPVH